MSSKWTQDVPGVRLELDADTLALTVRAGPAPWGRSHLVNPG